MTDKQKKKGRYHLWRLHFRDEKISLSVSKFGGFEDSMLICLLECLDVADRIREKAPSTSEG
jgi:hypothetical protein